MKKFFTLITALAATMSMMAGDFQLYFGDKPVENGATYTTKYTLENQDVYKGKTYYTWLQDANLFLHGTPGTDVTLEVSSEQEVAVCSLDNSCIMLNVPPTGNSVKKVGPIKENGESAEIHQETETVDDEDPQASMVTVTINVVAYETSAPDQKVSVKVVMSNEPAALAAVAASECYIKMGAGNVLNYHVDAPATLCLYSITGSLAAKYPIASTGTVSLNNLAKGIYIYTDGTRKGKIVVR